MFLAGSKKTRALLQIFVSLDIKVILVNTNPHLAASSEVCYSLVDVGAKEKIRMATLPRNGSTEFSYVRNLLGLKALIDELISVCGCPAVVWTYNAHAIESRLAGYCSRRYGSRSILEFEDWHFARINKVPIKPLLDWFFWRINVHSLNGAFVVNADLHSRMERLGIRPELLPGIIGSEIINATKAKRPFSDPEWIVIGYFGGLSREKGAGFMLHLMRYVARKSTRMRFIVTGAGELSSAFEQYGKEHPEVLRYYGAVNEDELARLMAESDVILNPHELNDGIFPFKLMEAVATGRVVISTPFKSGNHLPLGWMRVVRYSMLQVEAFYNVIASSREYYMQHRSEMILCARNIVDRYSYGALRDMFGAVLSERNRGGLLAGSDGAEGHL